MIACLRSLTCCVLLFALAGCSGSAPRPEWASSPDADLPAQTSFGWEQAQSAGPRTVLDARVRDALRSEMLAKGYTESADSPDFRIGYKAVPFQPGKRQSPVRIGFGVGSWGSSVGGSVGTSVGVGSRNDDRVLNRLMIRAVDAQEPRELWVGTSTSFEAIPSEGAVERAISGVMKGFPAKAD